MERGELWWGALPPPVGSGPGYRRPVVIVQADRFNRSGIQTVVVAAANVGSARGGLSQSRCPQERVGPRSILFV